MFERSKQGAVDIIQGSDPLNSDNVDVMRAVFERCCLSGQPKVVFDMHAVPLLDSAGLELLIETQENYRKRGGLLKLASTNPLCQEILKISGVGKMFESFSSSNAAVGSFVK